MSNILVNQTEKFIPDEQEVYLTLKRDLSWREGFGILFVRCTPVQESLIIEKVKQDIKDKKFDILKLEHSIDNLYDLIEEKVKDNPIDILFISGIEKSLALEDYIKRTLEKPKHSYKRYSRSRLLSHLNWQRERFRDDFNCCLVFTVRKYTLKYLVRRAPDFFDWRSGVIEFPVDRDIDLLQYYTPFQRYIEQDYIEKQKEKSFFEEKDIDIQEYISLLEKLLLLEYENNGDLQFIYSVVKCNTDKLDDFFAQLLQQWILDTCSELNPEEKEAIAGIVESLCLDISQFPLGRWSNVLEIAITGLETVLKLRPRETFPEQWATTINNLAYVYINRIFGNKADNLEKAITYYHKALEVRTREAFPEQWATTINNLAIAYTQRIRGYRGDNLEKAILYYSEALEVRTCEYFPVDWAKTQNNLGNAYIYRVYGDKRENLETAIACFDQSLQIYTKESFPQDWATTQNNLANAYRDRIIGYKSYNLEMAIACYQNALQIYTRDALPLLWAETQNNLANAYRDRIKGDKANNLEMAIACYQNALQIHTRDALPLLWAETLHNLGVAYSIRIRGKRADNIEKATDIYCKTLQIWTPEKFPLESLKASRRLGDLGFKESNWQLAIQAYNIAIKAVEIYRSWALTETRCQEIISQAITVYHNIIQSYINLGQRDKALEYVELIKSRTLVELLANRDLYPTGNIPPIIIQELDRLRREITIEQKRLSEREWLQSQLADYSKLNQLKQELDELISREIVPIDPAFKLTQKVEPITFEEIQTLIND
ncbi:MAG: tetratricopeptide repeat protein [Xenococcaceae cyanobacterium]